MRKQRYKERIRSWNEGHRETTFVFEGEMRDATAKQTAQLRAEKQKCLSVDEKIRYKGLNGFRRIFKSLPTIESL